MSNKFLVVSDSEEPHISESLEDENLWPNDANVAFSRKGNTWFAHMVDVNDTPVKKKIGDGVFLIVDSDDPTIFKVADEKSWEEDSLCFAVSPEHDGRIMQHFEDEDEDDLVYDESIDEA